MRRTKKDFYEMILKKKAYIVLISVIFAITAVCYTLMNIEFVANRKILLKTSDNISTYKEILTGSEVLGEVIKNLGMTLDTQQLEKNVEVNNVDDTNMIEIKVTGENSTEIVSILDEIIQVFKNKINTIYGEVEVFNVDDSANYYSKGNSVLIGIIAFIVGGVLSSLFFAISFLFDNKIKSCSQIEEMTNLKSLISIPYMKNIAKKRLNIRNIKPHKSQIFKVLMTNIQFVDVNNLQSKAIVITSPKPFEGKTYVATNLAIEFAKAGKKVILIDADMNRGRLSKIFDLPNDLGFSNYLSNLDSNGNSINERINSFINDTEIKNLNVITSGNTPPNPIELLRNPKVKELIKDLKVFYDIIIFDTVAILETQEARTLAGICDLTLMMSAYGNNKVDEFVNAYEQIKNTDGSMIGLGLNKIPERKVKRSFSNFKNRLKIRVNKILRKIDFEKLKTLPEKLEKLEVVFECIVEFFVKLFCVLRNMLKVVKHKIKIQSRQVKEHMKNRKPKKEEVRLIEASNEQQEKNIVREVFESELAKLDIAETKVEVSNVSFVKVEPEKQVKSKFDLMKEQQEKEIIVANKVEEEIVEKVEKENPKEIEQLENVKKIEPEVKEKSKKIVVKVKSKTPQTQQEMKRIREELIEKQRKEREKKEAEKKKLVREKREDYEDIDFANEENITEEMIRHQVEMDDMRRVAENEMEEEKENAKRQKLFEKEQKRKEREARKEQKAKIKEEKKAIKERKRQLRREETRLREDLQEDNLYPKIRM